MKIGSYEMPDACPDDCTFRNDVDAFSQGSMCYRCPIINCIPFEYDGKKFTLVDADVYRLDWAAEWDEFFRTGKVPELHLEPPKKEDT
jgi:hypothetical protein